MGGEQGRATPRWLLALGVSLVVGAALFWGPALADHSGAFGGFEIDGDRDVDSSNLDWDSPPPNLTEFIDTAGGGDDIFKQGSKQFEPGGWVCDTGKAPKKNDLIGGAIASHESGGDQYVFFNWARSGTTGDANIDVEFNQSDEPNPACPELPRRTEGDLLLAFDTAQGGKSIEVRAFEWQGTAQVGEFQELDIGSRGENWEGEVNIPNEEPHRIDDLEAGQFGEGGLNLSETIGDIACGQFSAAYLKTRASTSINAELKDHTAAQPVDLGLCPESELHKSVRNVSESEPFGDDPETPSSTEADAGQTVEYRLTYHNHGAGLATDVSITDEVPDHTTLVDCSPGCGATQGDGPGTEVSWSFDEVAAGGEEVVFFSVQLDDSFPEGTTTLANTATADSAEEEEPTDSNETTVTVEAAPAFTVDKTADEEVVEVGASTTYRITVENVGDAPGATDVVDDYDQGHVDVSNISDGGADDGDTVTWSDVTLGAGESVELTYTATFTGPFEGPSGEDPCADGEFPVVNTVTVDGDSADHTVCVAATPEFTVDKTSSADAVEVGGSTTYRITVENVGNAPGATDVVDDYDQGHVDVSNISDGGTDDGDTVTWSDVTLGAGESVELTYTATFIGPFEGPSGEDPCADGEFPVVNTVTVDGDSADHTVCVAATPEFTVDKTSSADAVEVGDTVTYTVTVDNIGDAPGSTDVVDDYDEEHVEVSKISDGGVDEDGAVTWSDVQLDAGESVALTYEATFSGPFEGPSGEDPCADGEFPVVNTVTVDGDSADHTVCVTAAPDLNLEKSTDVADATITAGDHITYTLAFTNDGDAAADDVVITEQVPESTGFVGCSDGCTHDGGEVTWQLGTVGAGKSGSVTLTVEVTETVGCQICNQATISSSDQADVPSNEVCIDTTPAPNPDGANASGSALGAQVTEQKLLGEDVTIVGPVDSNQSGVGSDSNSDKLLSIQIQGSGDSNTLSAEVVRVTSDSDVSEDPAQARNVSTATTAGVSLLDGQITADAIRGVAEATATGSSASFSAAGSTFENLVIGDTAYDDVAPNTRVDITGLEGIAGNSYAVLKERVGTTDAPDDGQLSGGTYTADLTVNMIRIHIDDISTLVEGETEVIVSQAIAHADFPQTQLCEADPIQAVSGHAFNLSVATEPSLLPTMLGLVEIPSTGGSDHQHTVDVAVEGAATAESAESESTGSVEDDSRSDASSFAETQQACVLPEDDGSCLISASVARAQSNSTANSAGAASDPGGTELVGLEVAGETIDATPEPNTEILIPGVGVVILNEQVCDNGTTRPPGDDCSDGDSTGLTVRAIRLVVTAEVAGGPPPGAEVIVSEAHSDASWTDAP